MDIGLKAAIKQVKDIIVLSEFIKQTVPLKKRGDVFIGLCPFHEEKTPSFIVNNDKRYYRCFGCGVIGDIFAFIQKACKVSFLTAIEYAATYAGLPIDLSSLSYGSKLIPIKHNAYENFLQKLLWSYPYILDDPRAGGFLPECCTEINPPNNQDEILSQLNELKAWIASDAWKECKKHDTTFLLTQVAVNKIEQLVWYLRDKPPSYILPIYQSILKIKDYFRSLQEEDGSEINA